MQGGIRVRVDNANSRNLRKAVVLSKQSDFIEKKHAENVLTGRALA